MSAGRRRSTRTRACDISPAVREIVNRRDKGCIFCLAAYELPQGYIPELFRMEIMHFVSRSTGQKAASIITGCWISRPGETR